MNEFTACQTSVLSILVLPHFNIRDTSDKITIVANDRRDSIKQLITVGQGMNGLLRVRKSLH